MLHDDYMKLKETRQHGSNMYPFVKYHTLYPDDYTTFPLHWHDEMEIIYIQKGRLEINLNLQTHIAETGDIVLIKPGQLHSFHQLDGTLAETISILFQMEMLYTPSSDLKASGYLSAYRQDKLICQPILSIGDKHYREPFLHLQNIFDHQSQRLPFYELAVKAELLLFYQKLFSLFCSNDTVISKQTKKSSADMKKVIHYIHTHYKETISICQLSELVNLSEHYFMRFFKICTGMTCVDYMNEYRLSIAARMLVQTGSSVRDIAADCGIDNISYFNRLFKKKYAMTPVQYRKTKTKKILPFIDIDFIESQ